MLALNQLARFGEPLDPSDAGYLGDQSVRSVEQLLALCPAHRPTPLRRLKGLADHLGLDELYVKDEGGRLGIGSFKGLGGVHAVLRLLLQRAEHELRRPVLASELCEPHLRQIAAKLVMTCATDGNHGRAVAAGARIVGARAIIFAHERIAAERAAAIEQFGATLIRVSGSYDDAVKAATQAAREKGWTLVSDTISEGEDDQATRWVMQGYTVIAEELLRSLRVAPTHLFVQAGVGGLAAAIAARFALRLGKERPRLIVVEPEDAACLFASNSAGQVTEITPSAPTIMAMLECYKPSLLAWRVLARTATAFMTIRDSDAQLATQRLAHPLSSDMPIMAGESGAAGLAGLLAIVGDPAARDSLQLGSDSRVVVINTECALLPTTGA